MEVELCSFLVSAVDGKWSTSGRRSTPEQRIPVQTEQEDGRDPAAILIICSKEKLLAPVGNRTSKPTATILTTLLLRYIYYYIIIITIYYISYIEYIFYIIHNYN